MRLERLVFIAGAIALGSLFAGQASAQTDAARVIPLDEFRGLVTKAPAQTYFRLSLAKVRQPSDFEAMRQHLLTLYADVKPTHSFELESQTYDCVPIEQQPAVRLQGIRQIADPPPNLEGAAAPKEGFARAAEMVEATHAASSVTQVGAVSERDRFGNAIRCEAQTIPIRRITLEEMSRFSTLRDFLRKSPGEQGAPPASASAPPPCAPSPSCPPHKYSVFDQTVNNWGGNSSLNVWSPYVNTGANEVFSLTQQWYVGGSGTSLPGLQTVEIGWQNFPGKYGDERSRLFIYHTADGYNSTGCYNLECGDFVQTNGGVYLAGGFTHYSVTNGAQWEMAIQAQLYRGNWWLFYNGVAFGYYPGGLFHGGQLTQHATH